MTTEAEKVEANRLAREIPEQAEKLEAAVQVNGALVARTQLLTAERAALDNLASGIREALKPFDKFAESAQRLIEQRKLLEAERQKDAAIR